MRVQWVGHSTALVEIGGMRILTDPLLTRRVVHLRRRRSGPPPDIADVDAVLLSHAHLDHLHLPSLRRVHPNARIVTPIGTGRLLRSAGFGDVTEVRVGDRVALDGPLVTAEVVPAAHKHRRGPHSRITAPPVGYVVRGEGSSVYFAGDTDLFDDMALLDGIDVALLPIWGWGSTLGTGLIQPGIVVPIHWGTYAPEDGRRHLPSWFDSPPELFEGALADAGLSDTLRLLQPGESVNVS